MFLQEWRSLGVETNVSPANELSPKLPSRATTPELLTPKKEEPLSAKDKGSGLYR